MPMVDMITNVSISDTEKDILIKKFGQAISVIPGKSESQLMMRISGENTLAFQGNKQIPIAYIRTDVSGKSEEINYQRFGEEAIHILEKVLSIPKENIYLTVREIPYWVVRKE